MEISLDDAYSLKSPEDSKALYAKWAKSYESEFVSAQGYEHPKVIAEYFDKAVPEAKKVIDVGTGTGLVGLYLSKLRKVTIDGIDISPEMLAEANAKGVYRNLYERDLTKEIIDTDAPYDALICIGIFTHGHLGPAALDNLLPLIRPGGYYVIGANASYFKEQNFESCISALTAAGKITDAKYEAVRVYAPGSAHHDSLNVISSFQRR